jgi:hypothetical protein
MNLDETRECLAAQVTILRNTDKAKEAILNKKKERQTGKRKTIERHFMLMTAELHNKV